MGSIKRAIEKKKREIRWLKIKLILKIAAIILGPVILGIIIFVIKKKAKKKIKTRIKEKIMSHSPSKACDDDYETDDFEIYDETID